jgi:transcriptional regulator GlxA family with amidase domain
MSGAMRQRDAACRIGVVLYDGVEPIDVGGTIGVISMAARVLPAITAVTIAAVAGPVHLAGGLSVIAGYGFDDAPDCDALVVTGGPGWRAQVVDTDMLAFLRRQDAAHLASVCTGALILGAAGLLDGKPATTRRHAVGTETESPLTLLARYGAITREAQLVDAAGTPATGGGVSLAHDLTLHLIGRLYGPDARDEVARTIEYDRAFAANRAALGVFIAQ